jgi:oligogalacturonide transporter
MEYEIKKEDRVSFRAKVGFGAGDIFGGGATVIISTLYLIFLTDIIKINPFRAGLAIMLCKIWTALFNISFGAITDRMFSRFGRRRPYIFAGIPLIFISFLLLWYPVRVSNDWLRFAFVLGTYMFFSTVMGAVATSYNALSSEITHDYHERTAIMSARMFFAFVSALVCAVAPLEIIKRAATPAIGYELMAAIFGLIFAVPYIGVFLSTREQPLKKPANLSQFSLGIYLEPFKIKTFRTYMAGVLSMYLAMDVMMALMIYYMAYCIGRSGITNYILGLIIGIQILLIPLCLYISRIKGKRTTFLIGAMIWAIVMLACMTFKPNIADAYFFIFALLIGTGMAGVMSMVYAIYPDIPDVDELVSGQRREGLYAGIFIFLRKMSSAFVLFIVSIVLDIAAYKPPVNNIPQIQTGQFVLIIKYFFTLCPVMFLIASFYSMYRFPLTPQIHSRLKRLLMQREKTEEDEFMIDAEEKELINLLC